MLNGKFTKSSSLYLHLIIQSITCDTTFFMAKSYTVFRFIPVKGTFRDLSVWQTHWDTCPKLPSSLPSRKVSEESLDQDEIKELHKTSHKQCIITSNCQLYCQFSFMNLCGWESLCDIRQDCCYHFVSKPDFGRDAQ